MTTPEELEFFFKVLAECNIHRYDASKKLYKYVSVETAKLIFGNASLKFSTPEELDDNDFELSLLSNPSIEQQSEILEFHYKLSEPTATDNDVRNYFETGLGKERIENEFCLKMLQHTYGVMRKKYVIFCATTTNSNSRMWNNKKYGDEDKGFCIEYQLPLFTSNYYTLKVFYEKDVKPFGVYNNKGSLDEASIQRWYFTKRIEYQYEDEVRIFSDKFGVYFKGIVPFKKEVFTGLYYGKKTLPDDIFELELLLKNGYSFNACIKAIY